MLSETGVNLYTPKVYNKERIKALGSLIYTTPKDKVM